MGIPQSIYVIETLKNKIKIGITSNVKNRFSAIQCQSGNKIINSFFTEKCTDAYKTEHLLHKKYKDTRTVGEWFTIDFETVVDYLKTVELDIPVLKKKEPCEKLLNLPIHMAGWAVIHAFTKPCTENTFERLMDSIDEAIDMFCEYCCDEDEERPEETAMLKFELMRLLAKAKLIGKVGV